MTDFASTLKTSRLAAGLTQADLAERTGIARPNIAGYENRRREPLFATALKLLDAANACTEIEPPVTWFEPGPHLWWSGPPLELDMGQRPDRCRAYELVLREGSPQDIEALVDAVLLCEAWPDLTLPRSLRAAWAPLIAVALGSADLAEAS